MGPDTVLIPALRFVLTRHEDYDIVDFSVLVIVEQGEIDPHLVCLDAGICYAPR